jgi:hypothetical protein
MTTHEARPSKAAPAWERPRVDALIPEGIKSEAPICACLTGGDEIGFGSSIRIPHK